MEVVVEVLLLLLLLAENEERVDVSSLKPTGTSTFMLKGGEVSDEVDVTRRLM